MKKNPLFLFFYYYFMKIRQYSRKQICWVRWCHFQVDSFQNGNGLQGTFQRSDISLWQSWKFNPDFECFAAARENLCQLSPYVSVLFILFLFICSGLITKLPVYLANYRENEACPAGFFFFFNFFSFIYYYYFF